MWETKFHTHTDSGKLHGMSQSMAAVTGYPSGCRLSLCLLTPLSTVIEKITSSQIVMKFPALYGTWRFITTFTSACHVSLSWARSIQSMPPHPTSWRSILILWSHLCLGLASGLFPHCVQHAPPVSFFSIWSPEQYLVRSLCAKVLYSGTQ